MNKLKLLSLFLLFIAFAKAQNTALAFTAPGEKIAGIEVGSKGVKLSILEKPANENAAAKILKDTAVNTDFISYTAQSYDATLTAFTNLYLYAKNDCKIPAANIATAISSGVKAQADKAGKNAHIQTLIDAFRIKINEENRNVEVISVLKESILSHYGIVSNENRYNTFLIDIGSGNTKGGYFSSETKKFVMFQIPSGTKSTTNTTEKLCGANCNFDGFAKQVTPVVDSLEKNEIIYAVNASGAFPASNTMAISGGIAWATATLLQPEKTDVAYIDVTYKDIARFRENLIKYNADIPDTNKLIIKGITAQRQTEIRKELQRVLNVFDVKSLLGGTTLMLRIMRQFEGVTTTKKFRLIKTGQTGWITGYVLQKGAEIK